MIDMQATKIITHDGVAHQDDFISVCLALAVNPNAEMARTSVITEAMFNDPNIWIIDVGGRFDPELSNFDHHQMVEKDRCSIDLVLEKLGIVKEAKEAWQWLPNATKQDNFGIRKLAEDCGISSKDVFNIKGPIGKGMLDMFWHDTELMLPVMRKFGENLLKYLKDREVRRLVLEEKRGDIFNIAGTTAIDMRGYDDPGMMMYDVFGKDKPKITIMDSLRTDGTTIMSDMKNGGPNLCWFDGRPEVSFVHKSGFLMEVRRGYNHIELLNELDGRGK